MQTYRLPDGNTTDDAKVYSVAWRELGRVIEVLVPRAKLMAFDPDFLFDVKGASLSLPAWFVRVLAERARPVQGAKFKLSKVRAGACEMCKRTVHTVGPGRDRRFCRECIIVRAKLRGGDES